jgi:hypothetical protein
VVRHVIPFAFSHKPSTFTGRDGPSGHAAQPNLDGLALLLSMPDQSTTAVSPGLERTSEIDGQNTGSDNNSKLILLTVA